VAVFILVHLIESIVELFLLFLGYDLRAHGSQHQIFQFAIIIISSDQIISVSIYM
jgi:hypothetical protein